MSGCTYITHPSPLKNLGNKLRNVTPWASQDKNTNRNPCCPYPPCVPTMPGCDARQCPPPPCPQPMVNVRCVRGAWLDDLRRLGVINFVGDILTLLTFIFIMLAVAEYFLCPPLRLKGPTAKPYFFCSSCDDSAPPRPSSPPPPPPPSSPPPSRPPP
ncbi:hypothetical protein EGW08_022889, partial [Elysia chlorotica]